MISEYSPTHQLTGTTGPDGRLAELAYATADATQLLEGLYTTADGSIHDTYTHTALGLGAYTRDGVRTSILRDPDGRPIVFDTLGGSRFIPHIDPQGTVQALITSDGQVVGTYTYTPYGDYTPTGQAATDNPFRWLGALQDPHGRYHLGHRYYQPHHARFTQPDPSGQELNPYTYSFGDPINNLDPFGLNCSGLYFYGGSVLTVGGFVVGTIATGGAAVVVGGAFAVAGLIMGYGGYSQC